jgi:hypothetical protein
MNAGAIITKSLNNICLKNKIDCHLYLGESCIMAYDLNCVKYKQICTMPLHFLSRTSKISHLYDWICVYDNENIREVETMGEFHRNGMFLIPNFINTFEGYGEWRDKHFRQCMDMKTGHFIML